MAKLPAWMLVSILLNVDGMNYFAHGRAFLGEPYFLAGTALPDWMNVVDRRTRVRSKLALPFIEHDDLPTSALARGVIQHHRDDRWFHESRAFAELSLQFAVQIRDGLPRDEGFRPHFLGHILVEILLDASLIAAEPHLLEEYYQAIESLDGAVLQQAAERIAGRPIPRLGHFLGLFSRERFLSDYLDDGTLSYRLNQIMRRVRLPALPARFQQLLPRMRSAVAMRLDELLDQSERRSSPVVNHPT